MAWELFKTIGTLVDFGAKAYGYKAAHDDRKAIKAENERRQKQLEATQRQQRARNLALLSQSGLSFSGTPLLLLQDDEALMAQDQAYLAQQSIYANRAASNKQTVAGLELAAAPLLFEDLFDDDSKKNDDKAKG